jgi:hypothetical protein
MTFDKVIEDNNSVYVVHVEYGGIMYNYNDLSLYQQNIFYKDVLKYIYDNKMYPEELFETSSVSELYDCYAQHTSLRWPMYIVVSKDKEIVYSSYISDLYIAVSNIKNATNNERIYFYNHNARNEFIKAINTSCINNNEIINYRFGSLESLLPEHFLYNNLESHIAIFDLTKFDESLKRVSDHYPVNTPMDSMKNDYENFVANVNKKAIILDIIANKLLCI